MAKPAEEELTRMVVKIQAEVLALVCAVLGGVGLFTITAWLVFKGGRTVGPHLGLLSQYLPGYSVTWRGSFVGLLYGVLIGGVVGWAIATVYTAVARARQK